MLYLSETRAVLLVATRSFKKAARITALQRSQNEFLRLSMRLPSYLRTDLLHESAGLETISDRLTSLNSNLMKKMLKHEDIQKTVDKSLNVIPLNNYQSPLDMLLKNLD